MRAAAALPVLYSANGADRLEKIESDFYLLAHSHGVALLDGVTNWRRAFSEINGTDPRFGPAFQGWFEGAVPRQQFATDVLVDGLSFRRLTAWVMSAGARSEPLIRTISRPPPAPLEVQLSPGYSNLLHAWRGSNPIVSMINGNEHALAMLNCWPSYDFNDEAIPALETNVPIVDQTYIRQHIEAWIASVFLPLAAGRRLVANPLLHVLPPPPRANPQKSSYLEVLGSAVAEYGFAPDRLRLKWHGLYCRQLAGRLATIGCDVLFPPAEACDSLGLLKEEFAEGLTHGNASYGRLVAAQVGAWLDGVRR